MCVHGQFPKALTPLHLHPNPTSSLTDTKKSNMQQIPQCWVTNWGKKKQNKTKKRRFIEKHIKLQKNPLVSAPTNTEFVLNLEEKVNAYHWNNFDTELPLSFLRRYIYPIVIRDRVRLTRSQNFTLETCKQRQHISASCQLWLQHIITTVCHYLHYFYSYLFLYASRVSCPTNHWV